MKKSLMAISLILSILLISACSNQTAAKPKHLDDVVAYFKDKGFTVGDKQEKEYTMIGAVDGFAITIDGIQVELYEYDKADNSYLENIKRTRKLGDLNAVVNDRFLLAGGMGKIIQAFEEFK
jgi:ABC-type glycerol-3-phosphate transport system substrate-binding protein